MRQVKHTVFEATDGSKFLTEEDCARYEAKLAKENPAATVAGKSEAALRAAIEGDDKPLADAVEDLARLIAQARYARGEYRVNRQKRTRMNGDAAQPVPVTSFEDRAEAEGAGA